MPINAIADNLWYFGLKKYNCKNLYSVKYLFKDTNTNIFGFNVWDKYKYEYIWIDKKIGEYEYKDIGVDKTPIQIQIITFKLVFQNT